MSPDTRTSEREAERNVSTVYKFTFLCYCAFLFDTFLSRLHLYEAHPGREAAHPAVQEQHSYDHKCLKSRCTFLGSDSVCPLQLATTKTTEKKKSMLKSFHTWADHLALIICSYLFFHQWLFTKLLMNVCTCLNVAGVLIRRFFIRRTVPEKAVIQQVLTLNASKVTFFLLILGYNSHFDHITVKHTSGWTYTPEYGVLRDGTSCWAQQRVGHRKGPQPGQFGFQRR